MSSRTAVLRRDEEFVLDLRRLYESFGYKKFKMSKFEKYDLYMENKSFLRNTNIITVTDPAGRLLALKPDITLSIVKNIRGADIPEKVYYTENIYIADSNAGEIKETTQVGLEYIGDLDIRALAEVLILAAESLDASGENYRIAVSHMGFVSEILDSLGVTETEKERIFQLVSQKNLHGIKALCASLALKDEAVERLCGLITVCGELSKTIDGAKELVCGIGSEESLNELAELSSIVDSFGLSDKFILDFSVMNDISYYNGLLFQGYIDGVPKAVLSGGRYDNLLHRFGCESSAIGFGIYTELLNQYNHTNNEYDYEYLLLYATDCDHFAVIQMQKELSKDGNRCIALSAEPDWVKYKTKVVMASDGSVKHE